MSMKDGFFPKIVRMVVIHWCELSILPRHVPVLQVAVRELVV